MNKEHEQKNVNPLLLRLLQEEQTADRNSVLQSNLTDELFFCVKILLSVLTVMGNILILKNIILEGGI